MIKRLALAALLGLTLSTPALAQQMPSPEEIDKKVKETLDSLPKVEAKLEGVCTFVYPEVPSDPKEIAKRIGGSAGAPAGVDIDSLAKQYGPMVQKYLAKHLQRFGKLKVETPFKVRSKTVPKGDHEFGFLIQGNTVKDQRIAAVIIYVEGEKKPIAIKMKAKKAPMQEKLEIELKKDKKKDDRFHIFTKFLQTIGRSGSAMKIEKS